MYSALALNFIILRRNILPQWQCIDVLNIEQWDQRLVFCVYGEVVQTTEVF